MVAAPLLMRLFLDPEFFTPELTAQRESVIAFARYCLPQVFFYGMFVLVGQVLNSRGRFGPMMWAPIANNVVAVVILTTYLLTIGPAATGAEKQGGFTAGAEALLGIGSTLGIVVQFLVLVPYLRAAGFCYRPRFDFRGTGLGHTLRLGVWTVLFVVVNQVAYTVVVRIASSGTVDPTGGGGEGTGYTIYSNSFLLTMVPHAIITVSLATAMLPLLSSYAADGRLAAVGDAVSSTLRSAYALVVPVAALLAVMALDTAHVIWGYGSAADDYDNFAPSLALFGIGPGAVHRALPGAARLLRPRADPAGVLHPVRDRRHQHRRRDRAHPRSAGRRRPRRDWCSPTPAPTASARSRRTPCSRARSAASTGVAWCASWSGSSIAVGISAAVAWGLRELLAELVPGTGTWHAVLDLAVVGVSYLAIYLGLARLLRISEVNDVMALVTRRLRGRRGD